MEDDGILVSYYNILSLKIIGVAYPAAMEEVYLHGHSQLKSEFVDVLPCLNPNFHDVAEEFQAHELLHHEQYSPEIMRCTQPAFLWSEYFSIQPDPDGVLKWSQQIEAVGNEKVVNYYNQNTNCRVATVVLSEVVGSPCGLQHEVIHHKKSVNNVWTCSQLGVNANFAVWKFE